MLISQIVTTLRGLRKAPPLSLSPTNRRRLEESGDGAECQGRAPACIWSIQNLKARGEPTPPQKKKKPQFRVCCSAHTANFTIVTVFCGAFGGVGFQGAQNSLVVLSHILKGDL